MSCWYYENETMYAEYMKHICQGICVCSFLVHHLIKPIEYTICLYVFIDSIFIYYIFYILLYCLSWSSRKNAYRLMKYLPTIGVGSAPFVENFGFVCKQCLGSYLFEWIGLGAHLCDQIYREAFKNDGR